MIAPSSRRPRVLILSASTGNGHISAARALEAVCKSQGLEVAMADTLDYAPKAYRLWYAGGYEALVRWIPAAWGLLYRDSDKNSASFRFQTRLDVVLLKRLDALVRSFQPDWVLCTHSLPQPRLALLKSQGEPFKMGIVITDLHPHLMWLRGEPDAFFVPNEWSKRRLVERLPVAESRITITGIPVHPAFGAREARGEARLSAGLESDIPVILVSAGGIGGGPFEEVVQLLQKSETPLQAVVICGRNAGLHAHIAHALAQNPSRAGVKIILKGYISLQEMATLMHAADFMIGKPGGLTSSECLVAGCPLIIYAPFMIPGQEEDNARSLVENGAGIVAHNAQELGAVVKRLLENPAEVDSLRDNGLALGKPNATTDIIQAIRAWRERG